MRHSSSYFYVWIYLRLGELVMLDTADYGNAWKTTILDPAHVGSLLRKFAVPRLPFMSRFVNDFYSWQDRVRLTGAPGPVVLEKTSADVVVRSDGCEARLYGISPLSGEHLESIEHVATVASRPPFCGVDVIPTREQKLLIPAWRDPEMLGHAVLSLFRMAGPTGGKDARSVFDPPVPKYRKPLHRAAEEGNLGALPKRVSGRDMNPVDSAGTTPLMLAAAGGHGPVAARLIELGAAVDHRDIRGHSALHYAAENGHADTLDVLLSSGADASLVDETGGGALHSAAARGHVEAVERLLGAGADPNAGDGVFQSSPLHLAARGNHAHLVPVLLNAGATIDADNELGRTPLHLAAGYGHLETVRVLIEAGADIDRRDQDRETPLHRATFYQHAECMRALLDGGADPQPSNSGGDTPLHVAASMNRDEAARMLIGAGVDVETINGEGLTPLDLAISNRHLTGDDVYGYDRVWEHNAEVAEALLQGGASIVPDRLALGDRHALWPHLTPPGLADEDGNLDFTRFPNPHRARLMEEDSVYIAKEHYALQVGTLLDDAVLKRMPYLVGRLLESRALVNATRRLRGSPAVRIHPLPTPLYMAAVVGDIEIAQMLLDGGAAINAHVHESPVVLEGGVELSPDCDWILLDTPLDIAIKHGWVEMVRFLLERGASPPSARIERYVPDDHLFFYDRHQPIVECPEEKRAGIVAVFEEFGLAIRIPRSV